MVTEYSQKLEQPYTLSSRQSTASHLVVVVNSLSHATSFTPPQRPNSGSPEVNLGLMPGFGGCVRLPRKVGAGAASEWIFSGDIYNAETASSIGLVQGLFEPEALMEEVQRRAKTMASRSLACYSDRKKVIQDGLDLKQSDACTLEQSSFGTIFSSEDMREGTRAFLEKRSPEFKGS